QGFSHLAASVLAVASVVGSANVANAATFTFSFTNQPGSGDINGTVEGVIELPDGDGTFAATSFVVTSAPVEVLPPNGTDFALGASSNSFQVLDGAIVNATVEFFNFVDNTFVIQFIPEGFLEGAVVLGNDLSSVASDIDSVTYTPVAVSTPEPTSLLTLMGIGVLGVASKLKKKA
ncbi:MAG: PEP-CTERM sorting domain-containing protein, partial [Crocosphaera sp.]